MSAERLPKAPASQPLVTTLLQASDAASRFTSEARRHVAAKVLVNKQIDPVLVDSEQRIVHGLAWISTIAAALEQTAGWAERIDARNALGESEMLLLRIGFGEYLAQLTGGLPMSQNEIVRPVELGLEAAALQLAQDEAVVWLIRTGNTAPTRAALHLPAQSAGHEEFSTMRRRGSAAAIGSSAARVPSVQRSSTKISSSAG